MGQKITPFLWFEGQAEQAANFYASIFEDSKVVRVTHYWEGLEEQTGHAADTVLTVEFELAGQTFIAMNGGPGIEFNESVSLYVECNDQQEVDRYWSALLDGGGEEIQCGWLKDRYGLRWQIVPKGALDLVTDSDPEKATRAATAMMGMIKLDIAELQRAHDGA